MPKKWSGKCNDFIVIDFETTGLSAEANEIIEVSALKYIDRKFVGSYITLVKPKTRIPGYITQINGITNEMVKDSPCIEDVMPKLIDFIGDLLIVAHNANFDMKFLKYHAEKCGYKVSNPSLDTLILSRKAFPSLTNHKLATVAQHVGIKDGGWHRAEFDTRATAEILLKCLECLEHEVS
ncbi:MAG: 3'-5' exonuclease [Clostridia bacterium]|nr:3'-5' exonuclease [Clostridia bacterium]